MGFIFGALLAFAGCVYIETKEAGKLASVGAWFKGLF